MQHFYDFRLVATVRHGHKESSSRGTRSDSDCHSVALPGFCFCWPIAAITVSESKTISFTWFQLKDTFLLCDGLFLITALALALAVALSLSLVFVFHSHFIG